MVRDLCKRTKAEVFWPSEGLGKISLEVKVSG